jgi:hypothetical protein
MLGQVPHGRELGSLAAQIGRYVAAWDDFDGNGRRWVDSPASRSLKQFVAAVDGAHGPRAADVETK